MLNLLLRSTITTTIINKLTPNWDKGQRTHIVVILFLSILSKGMEFSFAEHERLIFDVDIRPRQGVVSFEPIGSQRT